MALMIFPPLHCRYGRKTIFVIITPILLVTLFFSALSFNPTIYAIGLILKGISVAGIYQSAFVIGIESLGGRWRLWLGNFYSIVFAIGAIYSCLMAEQFRTWRIIEISNILPTLLMLSFPW